jgi:hypothetical protein
MTIEQINSGTVEARSIVANIPTRGGCREEACGTAAEAKKR